MKTFLLVGFMLISFNIISCGQKGDLVRPQQVSKQSSEPQDKQNEQDEPDEPDEPDEQEEDKN